MKNTILPLLDALIKIPSVSSDIDKLHEIIDFVEAQFSEYPNAVIKKYEWNKKPSIVIQNFEWLEADIIMNGHLDVVPPSEENQFEPEYKGGKIFARWTGDMKAGDAIIITLMKEIFENSFIDKKVSLILTTDEEIGGEDGAKKIVEIWYKAKELVLVPDSGSAWSVVIAEKGILDFDVEITWKSWHSSRPWLWENAIERVIQLYSDMKEYIETPKKLSLENWYWSSTIQMTMIKGWIATNVIPETVRAHFNIRITEEFTDVEKFKHDIWNLIAKYNWEIKKFQEGSLVYTDPKNISIKEYINICEKTLWMKPGIEKEHGASDWRYFAEKWMFLILHRPDCENIHTAWEYVVEEAIFQIYDCYKNFIFKK